MNKFINNPDSLAGLAGCFFGIAVLAVLMGALFGTLYAILGGGLQ